MVVDGTYLQLYRLTLMMCEVSVRMCIYKRRLVEFVSFSGNRIARVCLHGGQSVIDLH